MEPINEHVFEYDWSDVFSPHPETVRKLLREQFPGQAKGPVEFLGEGWDCVAYRAGNWVFRFPRRPMGLETLSVERAMLPEIGIDILAGEPTETFPYPFLGTPFQNGVPLEEYGGPRTDVAADLGKFLRELHSRPSPEGLAPDGLGKFDPVKRKEQVTRLLGYLPEWLPDRSPVNQSQVLCHGDLYCRQIYVSPRGRLAGLIDWGDMHRGHRAVDLGCAWGCFDPVEREIFWGNYGEVDEETLLWSRFRALYHSLLVREYAEMKGFQALLGETEASLDRVLGSGPE